MINIIAEIGINHNGDIELCKKLMNISKLAGFNYCKIQKRNPELCVPKHQRDIPKNTPWGTISYLDYKKKIEFNEDQINELFEYSKSIDIKLFASIWDIDSLFLMKQFTNVCKIPSALINDLELCKLAREHFDFLIISTGMSSEEEVVECIKACNPDVIMHTNSTYPCPTDELNLNYILHLKQLYPDKQIGYSGHEYGLITTFSTIPMGVTWIERHVTLDQQMWGSDQSSSIEPIGMFKLIKGVRAIESSIQYKPGPRIEFKKESIKKKSLRN